MVITYIANTLFLIFLAFWIWFVIASIVYKDESDKNHPFKGKEGFHQGDDYRSDNYH
jgi:hypothetical protein